MKTFKIWAGFACLYFVSCGNVQKESQQDKNLSFDLLTYRYDPVCKMDMEKHSIVDTTTYNGKVYGFCHSGCKEAFLANPQTYLSE